MSGRVGGVILRAVLAGVSALTGLALLVAAPALLAPAPAEAQIAGGLRLEGVQTCAQLQTFLTRNRGFDQAMVASKREALGGCVPVHPVAPARPTPVRPAPAHPTPAHPTPAHSTPAHPRPARPSPVRPVPAQPVPSRPRPVPPVRTAPLVVAPPVVAPARPSLTPRLNAPTLTPRLNTTTNPTPGLNRVTGDVLTLHLAPERCRWDETGVAPMLQCQDAAAAWRPVQDPNITVETVANAQRGEALAMANLGYFYDVQPEPVRNRPEALRLYRAAADQGSAIARYNLAVLYQTGSPGVLDADPEASRRYLMQAADQGLALAMRKLAETAGKGDDVDAVPGGRTLTKGQWYVRAADAGDAVSMGKAAEFYRSGDGGLAQDMDAARRWGVRADHAGDAWGRYILGLISEDPNGDVVRDEAEAYRLFRLAAEAGVGPARGKVGEYLYQGWADLRQDDAEALAWLEPAARDGDANAEYYLALFYVDGLGGVTRDAVRAADLMLTAAQAGDVRAMYRAGQNYEIGQGVPRDIIEARHWYRLAADGGDVAARDRLDLVGR